MSVLKAVRDDIAALELRKPGVADSSEAALAVALAGRLDDVGTPASAVGQIAARLLEALEVLRANVPETEMSPLDKIRERRRQRSARGSDTKDRVATA